MKYLFIIILSLISLSKINACSCIFRDDISTEIKYSEIIFSGKLIEKKEEVFWFPITDIIKKYKRHRKNAYKSYTKSNIPKADWDILSFSEYKKNRGGHKLNKYSFNIIQFYKGNYLLDTIDVFSEKHISACGIYMEENIEYLVYGFNIENNYEYSKRTKNKFPIIHKTNTCTRTDKIIQLADDIAYLEKHYYQ